MRFRRLYERDQLPAWRAHYADYRSLKHIVGQLRGRLSASEATGIVERFDAAWRVQASRVDTFIVQQLAALQTDPHLSAHHDDEAPHTPLVSDSSSTRTMDASTWQQWLALRRFARLNYTALYRAARSCDKHAHAVSHVDTLLAELHAMSFMHVFEDAHDPDLLHDRAGFQVPRGDAHGDHGNDAESSSTAAGAYVSAAAYSVAAATGEATHAQQSHGMAATAAAHACDTALRTLERAACDAVLQIAPDLRDGSDELHSRMQPLHALVLKHRQHMDARVHATADVMKIMTATHTALLEVFNCTMDVVAAQSALVMPEAAAALQLMSATFNDVILQGYSRRHSMTPLDARLVHRLQADAVDAHAGLHRLTQHQQQQRVNLPSPVSADSTNNVYSFDSRRVHVDVLASVHGHAARAHDLPESAPLDAQGAITVHTQLPAASRQAESVHHDVEACISAPHNDDARSRSSLWMLPVTPAAMALPQAIMRGLQQIHTMIPGGHDAYGWLPEKLHAFTWRSLMLRLVRACTPAIAEWLPMYDIRKDGIKDVIAGVTIGVMAIPQGLALATVRSRVVKTIFTTSHVLIVQLAGLPLRYGLFTGIPGCIYAVFGTSRHAAIGPMTQVALLLSAGLANSGIAPSSPEYVQTVLSISLLSGIIHFAMGLARLSFVVRFISAPVMSGFVTASAVITIASVVKDLIGVAVPRSQVMHEILPLIANSLPHTSAATLVTSIIAVAALVGLPRIHVLRNVPPTLIVVLGALLVFFCAMVATKDAGDAGVTAFGVSIVGDIPRSLPDALLPTFDASKAATVLTTAFSIAFVGFMESISVAKTYAVKHGYEVDATSELLALGAVNVVGSCFGSFTVMAGFSRSAVNEATGARTPMTQIISTLVVLLVILAATPALFYLPRAVLASLMLVGAAKLIDIRTPRQLWHISKLDCAVWACACVATLFAGVLYGVCMAMAMSLLVFLALSTQPRVEELGRLHGTVVYRHIGMLGVARVNDVKILRFLAPLYFANASVLRDRMMTELTQRGQLPPKLRWKALVLCFSSVSSVDATSLQTLHELIDACQRHGAVLLIAAPNAIVEDDLHAAGVVAHLGGSNRVFSRVHDAVRAVLLGLMACEATGTVVAVEGGIRADVAHPPTAVGAVQ